MNKNNMTIKTKKIITVCGALVVMFLSIYLSPIFIFLIVFLFQYFSILRNREIKKSIIERFENNENFIISKDNNWCCNDDKFIDLASLIVDYKVNNRNYIQKRG